ncbi:DNA topoisomerase subunit B [Mycoplasmopsis felis]|uniref:DNA topoisomerase subunit B n=1 Tax=Mycoplasmopsis felis TaxID=33923 RepID=UPI00055F9FB6|nr:DNA topoisomerase subunit B [Mycoplasmopsis felis]WQQ01963.1 DNA topoisomerase subunit B [Mycoplasmopsis felis]WQQ04242.1 DNA topoisomerase subunit B [Mycoplasmopsis felis]WQQ07310.1 DNA topoisomerase subunit B [Mycoplasmopsis felis]WQQ07382.1 DNA topoisomerase subunit B [Mycoplasmopsis felis]WQQ11213.1 DNA topoisomerase subunit B [Mycoplasmopsis felis]
MSENKKNEYNASNIKHLEGLEHVRKRPGMYIGSTSKSGLHHMVWEIVDNSVDEAMAGYAKKINITITKNDEIIVEDDGRGIPIGMHPKFGISALEVVLTKLNAGGKFESNAYKVSGGLHGVGASVVNALSDSMKAWVKRDGNIYYAEFGNGGQTIKSTSIIDTYQGNETGTKIQFHPDFKIMDKIPFDKELILDHAKQIAHLNKGLFISVNDLRDNTYNEFQYENGIVDYVKELTQGYKPITTDVIYASGDYKYINDINQEEVIIGVEVAVQYLEDLYRSNIISYTNNISTHEGGSHLSGFYDSLMRLINTYAIEKGYLKNESDKYTRDDLIEGLTAIISIKHPDPQFEGQTKGKLGSKDARRAVNEIYSNVLERFLNENPNIAKKIVELASLAKKGRLASNAARDNARRKNVFESGGLPGKLSDCASKNAEISELYLVEGNSAGGSAKMGRDRNTQAILPLRGKILNVEKTRPERVFDNEEIMSLITALGTGLGDNFNINKLRYHKIVIMTDADVDGAHIRILLLTFFYRYFKQLIEYGFIYIAQPPLYKIQQNKFVEYAFNDAQKDEIIAKLNPNQKITIQRYKGLGEMDPEQLWETTMNPTNRKMLQVQIQDAYKADKIFETLMGDNVLPRKQFIEENAKYVKNIDL